MRLTANAAFKKGSTGVRQLAGLAGPFWQALYGGQQSLHDVLETTKQQHRQNLRRLTEIASLADFNDLPLYHTETFYPLYVPVADVTYRPIRYGEGYQYGEADGTQTYGQKVLDSWNLPKPGEVKQAAAVMDRPYKSKYCVTNNHGVTFTRDSVEIRTNPADVFVQVEIEDQPHYLVWLYMADIDEKFLTYRYGAIFGTSFTTGDAQRDAIKYAMRSLIDGASEFSLRGLLASAVGNQIAEEGEKVELVLNEYERTTVITNYRTIYGQYGENPVVDAGQSLMSGDFFFDSVRLSDPPEFPDWLTSVTLPPGITGGDAISLASGLLDATAETRNGLLYIYPTVLGDSELWRRLNLHDDPLSVAVVDHYGLQVADPLTASPLVVPSQIDFASVLFGKSFGYKLSVSLLNSDYLVPGAVEILRLIRSSTPPWVRHIVEFSGDPPVGWLNNDGQCC